MSQGLGSLVRAGKDYRIITHNHWGALVLQAPPEQVEKLSASPDAFREASLDDGLKLNTGDQVLVVHQKPGQEDKVAVMPAVIEQRVTFRGLPAFRLHASGGSALIPGDSGGSLWFNGYLVEDLWAREEVSQDDWNQWSWQDFKPGVKVLESAYAAQITM